MVQAQLAHNLLGTLEFRVSISENNWDGIQVIEVGGFRASWSSRSIGRATPRRGMK